MSFDNVKVHPSSQISQAIDLYFQYCHRQPIWCFDREEIKDLSHISEELVCSILTLTSRFSKERDEMLHYGDTARTLVMLRIANGTVELETIESLCLLAYSSFVGRSAPVSFMTIRSKYLQIIRWQCTPWQISPWSFPSALSLCNARP